MSPRDISKVHAKTCQAFANPTRIEIIELLIEQDRSTEEIAQLLNTSSPNVSQHLKIMRDRGLIESSRDNHKTLHRLTNPKIIRLFKLEREILSDIYNQTATLFDHDEPKDDVKNPSE